jgi:hypothetical protein
MIRDRPGSVQPSEIASASNAILREDHLDGWTAGFALAGCAAFFLSLIAYNFVDIDLWHQLALIRDSLAAGHLLKQDPYAYVPTIRPWVDQEWGAGALAYLGTTWLGPKWILVLKFIAAFATAAACALHARLSGTDLRLVVLCAPLAFFLMYLGFLATVRAQAYSFALTALLLCLLEIDRHGVRTWIVPWLLLFPLWVNLHAGFVVGIGILALHALEQAARGFPWRHLLITIFAMGLEISINPYGFGYFHYLRRAILMARPYSPEWGSFVTLGTPLATAFALALLLGAYAAWKAGWRCAQGIPILFATAVEGALHRKLMPLFAITWLCYVPSYLQHTPIGGWWLGFYSRRRKFMSLAWTVFFCSCAFAAVRERPWKLSVPQPLYPVGPVLYLQQQKFTGNLLVPFRIGAFVSWKLYPAVKVSLDSRYEVTYSDAVMKQIFDFYDGRAGWQSTLVAYPTDAVLLPKDAPVLTEIGSSGWHRVYTDREFRIYVRPGRDLPVEDWSAGSFAGTFP